MKRIAVVAGVLLLSAGAVWAQQDSVDKVQKLMKENGRNAMALGGIVKGEKPYDQSAVDAALKQFAETAKALPTAFPDAAKGLKPADAKYSASPKIWEDRKGFEADIAGFAKAVQDADGKIKDVDTLKVSFGAIGKACGACHETYRQKEG